MCGIGEIRGVCRRRNRVLGRDGDHGSRQLAPQDASVEGDDDLNRVVCVRGNDALCSGDEKEASLPQVPARNAQPAIRPFGVGAVGQAAILPVGAAAAVAGRLSNIAATFKNFDLSVQSPTPVRSLLFESHRGDFCRAEIRR